VIVLFVWFLFLTQVLNVINLQYNKHVASPSCWRNHNIRSNPNNHVCLYCTMWQISLSLTFSPVMFTTKQPLHKISDDRKDNTYLLWLIYVVGIPTSVIEIFFSPQKKKNHSLFMSKDVFFKIKQLLNRFACVSIKCCKYYSGHRILATTDI
jgi:hypothetical protein